MRCYSQYPTRVLWSCPTRPFSPDGERSRDVGVLPEATASVTPSRSNNNNNNNTTGFTPTVSSCMGPPRGEGWGSESRANTIQPVDPTPTRPLAEQSGPPDPNNCCAIQTSFVFLCSEGVNPDHGPRDITNSGDIEKNPGPSKCYSCEKLIRQNADFLE